MSEGKTNTGAVVYRTKFSFFLRPVKFVKCTLRKSEAAHSFGSGCRIQRTFSSHRQINTYFGNGMVYKYEGRRVSEICRRKKRNSKRSGSDDVALGS